MRCTDIICQLTCQFNAEYKLIIEINTERLPELADLSGSLSERVYSALKSAILSLEFPPGAVIKKAAVCEWFGLSRSPVSDALIKLSSEGLVDIVPQSGTRVSPLSMAAVRDDVFLREALEVAAASHAAMYRSDDVLARLSRNIEMQKMLIAEIDNDEFFQTDIIFHETIMATTNVARLPTAVRTLSQHVDRARRLLVPEPGRLADTVDEHIKIFEAIGNKDCDLAQEAMRLHVRQLIKRLEPLEAARPDLFSSRV